MLTATVNWFDASSGEGIVTVLESGETLYLNFTCIAGIDRNNYQWPTEADRQRLAGIAGKTGPVTIYRNLYSARVQSIDIGLSARV